MADDKKDTPVGRTGGPGAGAAETVTPAAPRGTTTSVPADTGSGRRSGGRQELSGADRDKGVRTGSRTGGTTEAMAEEFERLGVDARLDNRVGDQRPRLSPHLKPQQVPGPEVGHFGEHADDNGEAFLEATGLGDQRGEVLGSRSLGQLGRGEADRDETEPVQAQPK